MFGFRPKKKAIYGPWGVRIYMGEVTKLFSNFWLIIFLKGKIMPEDKEFIPGLYVKEPNQEWLKAKISIKVADLKNYLEN